MRFYLPILLMSMRVLAQNTPVGAPQQTPATPDLKVEPSRVDGSQGLDKRQILRIQGGKPKYTIGAFSNMPEIVARLQNGNEILVTGACGKAEQTDSMTVRDSTQQEFQVEFFCVGASPEDKTEYMAYLGLQQSQASSSDRTWKLFGELGFSFKLYNYWRFFIDLQPTSVPQQVGFNVSQAITQGTALVKKLNINEAVQSVNLLTGFEGFDILRDSSPVLTIKPVVLGGFSTPLSPKESVAIYNSTQDAFDAFGIKVDHHGQPVNPTTYPYLALTTPDRTRFYSQWYTGFRIKIKDQNFLGQSAATNYPAYFDMTFGQNSAITAGQLRYIMWRLAGFVPIPKLPLAIFGTSYSVITRNLDSSPLFLSPPTDANGNPTTISLPDPMNRVYIVSRKENRDFYQIGIALDLGWIADKIGLIEKLKGMPAASNPPR